VLCATAAPAARLTLLHTSDLHGAVLAHDDLRDRPAPGGLVRVAAAVARIRAAADHPVLLLDGGDTIQGSPLEELVHVEWGEPSPTVLAMNVLGYAAMAVGNHEFNFGIEVLRDAERQARFPFLAANVVDAATGEPAFRPYLVVEAGPLRVGVLGLTTSAIPRWELPDHYRGLRFAPMDEAARRWVPVLRGRERCDLVVVLAHTGFERDPDSGRELGGREENFAWRLAHVPGIDVLLTGHTHRNLPPRRVAGTIVSQPGARARYLTRIDLELERRGGRWRLVRWSGSNLDLAEGDLDPVLAARFEPLHRRVAAALDEPVGETTAPLSVRGCRLGDCAALDLIHAAQLEASGAELSLASILSDRTPELPPGPIPRRWVRALYPYANWPVVVRLTGAQLRDILEHAARYDDGLECPPGRPCVLLADADVRRYNVDTVEGMEYRVDPTAPEGHRIWALRFRGRPLDLHAVFTVVCNSYRAAGGGGFPHLAEAEVVWRGSEPMWKVLEAYLARHRPLAPAASGNWVIAPRLAGERFLRGPGGEDRVRP